MASENTYTLWHNFILLNLYILLIQTSMIDGEESDLFNEVVQLQRDIFTRLDPLWDFNYNAQARGVTVIQNNLCWLWLRVCCKKQQISE